jgi:hypothetical protein
MNLKLDTVFGADPEVFIFDKKYNTIVPPAALRDDCGVNFVDGKTILLGDDWRIIEDGAATEINIFPSDDFYQLYGRIGLAKQNLQTLAHQMGFTVVSRASVPFDPDKYWVGRDESFRDCVRFGCDPDLDIYTGEFSKEVSVDNVRQRFGGGHIHMQAPKDEKDLFESIFYHTTRLMDIIVGNTAVSLKRPSNLDDEDEKNRLKFYGRPGKIRLQNYPDGNKGIEYRVPSNFWLNSVTNAEIVFKLMNAVFNLSRYPNDATKFLTAPYTEDAPRNIVSYNKKSANSLSMQILDLLTSMGYIDISDLVKIIRNIG